MSPKVLCIAVLLGAAVRAFANDCTIDVDKELWIRDLSVIDDPVRTVYVQNPPTPSHGAWTFGRLIENMAGANDPSKFCLHLFENFDHDQVVNGFTIPARPGMLAEVIQPWIEQSQANGFDGLDFSIAPFLLTGIVNRIDLRANGGYGMPNSAGEGRIVFTAQSGFGGGSTRMTVIFEYELVAESCEDVREWAKEWHALGSMKFGEDYNAALEKIVNRFAGKGAAPGRINDSALHQFRSNELVGEFPWQWREFHLEKTTLLEQATVAQTPATVLNQTKAFRDYVNQNEADILAGNHVIPLDFAGAPFRGGASDGDQPNFLTAHFRAKGINNNDARHIVSLNACVACHTEETQTNFFQAFRGGPGQQTFLSAFLTGETIPDPVVPSTLRTFNDLQRRADDLCKLLNSDCADIAIEKPLLRVH